MKKGKKVLRNKWFILIMALLSIVCYLYCENNILEINKYNINIDISEEYKIAQISDYHNTTSNMINNKLIKTLKKEKPNIIVITGDLIDSNTPKEDIALKLVDKLINIAPVYYVNGNHEALYNNYNDFEESLRNYKIKVLRNTYEIIKIGDKTISLIGIDDESFRVPSSSTIKGLKGDSDYSILLSHRPEYFDTYVEADVDLVFSGHAHGGQIRIPFIGGLIAPNQGLFPEYDSGKYKENNTIMIVSRGIGNSIVPFRVNNNPELIITTLK